MQCVLTRITAHQAACKAGVLHGNLSPGNIMLIDSEMGTDINNGMLIVKPSCDPAPGDLVGPG